LWIDRAELRCLELADLLQLRGALLGMRFG
jgi:hypothetical protein